METTIFACTRAFARNNIVIPDQKDWQELKKLVIEYGLYNRNLQAVPPTGSISYINHATSSIHPIASKIEIRKEGKLDAFIIPLLIWIIRIWIFIRMLMRLVLKKLLILMLLLHSMLTKVFR